MYTLRQKPTKLRKRVEVEAVTVKGKEKEIPENVGSM